MKKITFLATITSIIACFCILPVASKSEQINLSDQNKITGQAAGDIAGSDIASGMDVNSDGYDDILIGARGEATKGENTGAAYLIYGNGGTSELTDPINLVNASAKFIGENADDKAGFSVAFAGDVNNDNYADIIIGAPSAAADNGYDNPGAVYLFYGGANADLISGTIQLSSADVIIHGTYDFGDFGFSLSSAGDVNNDNYDDFLIGAFDQDVDIHENGAAYLVYGGTNLSLLTTAIIETSMVQFYGEAVDDAAGWSVSTAGDVNKDGFSDFFIGSPASDRNGTDAGAVYLIYGQITHYSSTVSLANANAIFTGVAAEENAGIAISSAGDFNGDSYSDFLIGAWQASKNALGNGAAYLVTGQSTNYSGTYSLSIATKTYSGENSLDMAGLAVSDAGDVNYDGYSDILIGAPQNDEDALTPGRAYLIYGSNNQTVETISLANADKIYIGKNASDAAGGALAGGDLNNDNYSDILISAMYNDEQGIDAGVVYFSYVNRAVAAPPEEPPEEELHSDANLLSVEGNSEGKVKINLDDDSSQDLTVYNNLKTKKLTKVKRFRKSDFYLVLHPFGKKVALIKVTKDTKEVLRRKTIDKKNKYKYSALKIYKFRKKYFATVIARKNLHTKLAIIRIMPKKQKISTKSSVDIQKLKIKPIKTSKAKNTINLKNAKKKILARYFVTKLFKLQKK